MDLGPTNSKWNFNIKITNTIFGSDRSVYFNEICGFNINLRIQHKTTDLTIELFVY